MEIKKTSIFAPYMVFLPVIMVQLGLVVYRGLIGPLGVLIGVVAGLFSWTLIEYGLHRFSFHSKSEAEWVKPFNSGLHLWHHDNTTSMDYIAAPVALGIPVYSIFLAVAFVVSRNIDLVLIAGSGVLGGYLFYEWVHYMSHILPAKNRVTKFLKRYHLTHHFQDKDNFFGVTSPLWDMVFGTRPVRASRRGAVPKPAGNDS